MYVFDELEQRSFHRRKLFIFILAIFIRSIYWVFNPLDWNWDSYHHWQISFFSLKIGFSKYRLWDLNGCEYYWGIVPHIVESFLLKIFSTTNILPMRILNLFLGGLNSTFIFYIGDNFYSRKNGFFSGILYAIFPIASVFDILAMQDTIGLSFLLGSLILLKDRPFWSGFLLGLAGQSRTELWLVSILILTGYYFYEKIHTESLPFLFGWLVISIIFGYHIYNWTGNPIYPFYVSLYNIFGGYKQENVGKNFCYLMIKWVLWKLSVWPFKITGILILVFTLAMFILIPWMSIKKWFTYQPILYFITTTTILLPIFITYFGSNYSHFLIMLRMGVPIVALGLPILINFFSLIYNWLEINSNWLQLERLLILIFLVFSIKIIPSYHGFQQETINAFESADELVKFYSNGTIICDYPTINYRLISKWGFNPNNLLGNLYAPNYYGVNEPVEYLKWFDENNVTLWTYYDYRANEVWSILSENFPKVLIFVNDINSIRIYSVNKTELLNQIDFHS